MKLVTNTDRAYAIARDIETWMRSTKLPLARLAKWAEVVNCLRRMADDLRTQVRRAEHLAYDLEFSRKEVAGLRAEVETLKQHIVK